MTRALGQAGLWARSLAYLVWFYGSMTVLGLLFAPLAIASAGGAHWAVRFHCRQALWVLRALCGLEVEVRGDPPEGAALIAAKHQSFLDIIVLSAVLPRPKFVMKRSLVWAPVLGLYALRMGAAPLDRTAGPAALRAMRRRAERWRNAEDEAQVVIFPQGARIAPGAAAPYRRGVAALYRSGAVPCSPVAVNVGLFWPRRGVLRRPGRAVVAFLPPLAPGLETDAFMAELERRVETASDALLAEASG